MRAMIETRPDWCISRQRHWGVPLSIFVNKATGEILRDQAVIDRIADAVEQEGGDAWLTSPPERFLGNTYNADEWTQVTGHCRSVVRFRALLMCLPLKRAMILNGQRICIWRGPISTEVGSTRHCWNRVERVVARPLTRF